MPKHQEDRGRRCKYCHLEATHKDSVPDASAPGTNLNECGYKVVYYCSFHADQVRRDVGNTSRVEPIEFLEASLG